MHNSLFLALNTTSDGFRLTVNGISPGVGVLFVGSNQSIVGSRQWHSRDRPRSVRQRALLLWFPVHRAQRSNAFEFHIPFEPVSVLVARPEVLHSSLELEAQRGDHQPLTTDVIYIRASKIRRVYLRKRKSHNY